MSEVFVLFWIFSGLLGCHFAWAVSVAHADDKGLDKFGRPSHVWYALAGPLMLLVWGLIALGYALNLGKNRGVRDDRPRIR